MVSFMGLRRLLVFFAVFTVKKSVQICLFLGHDFYTDFYTFRQELVERRMVARDFDFLLL